MFCDTILKYLCIYFIEKVSGFHVKAGREPVSLEEVLQS